MGTGGWNGLIGVVGCCAALVLGGQGAATAAVYDNHISLVSVASPEAIGNGSLAQDMTPDGRYVVFASYQPNLVPGQTSDGGNYVYRRDLVTGTTTRVSPAGSHGSLTGNVSVSANGRYVSYAAQPSSNVITRLYRYDATTGVNTVISRPKSASEIGGVWFKNDISPDGRHVVYIRSSTTDGQSYVRRLFRYDAATGSTQQLLARDVGGNRSSINYFSTPSVGGSGRFVALVTAVDPTVEPTRYRLQRLDTATGGLRTIATSGLSYNIDTAFSGPDMSADGRYVAYNDEALDVYTYDATTGTSTLVSRTPDGAPGNGQDLDPDISSTGRYVSYTSTSTDIAAGPLGAATVLLHDRVTGTTRAIVRNRQGEFGDPTKTGTTSAFSSVSNDGRTVSFTSTVRGLVPNTPESIERVLVWKG